MRWVVLALLFSATAINYLDRLLFSTLSPVLRDEFRFSPSLYGYLSAALQASYPVLLLVLGRWLDRVGTRNGLMAPAVTSAGHFAIWRAILGFAEGANFPAAFKALAEWFTQEERSFATGILNAGVNAASITLHDGGMAVRQVAQAFQLFTGVAADASRMARHFEEMS